MRTIKKNFNAIILCTGFVVVICLAFIISKPGYAVAVANGTNTNTSTFVRPMNANTNAQWLSQFEGKRVRITFVEAPTHIATDLRKTTYIDLINVGPTGIVVGVRPQRTIFFPYTQIVTIEPTYNER